jgi:hypothetical protein
MFSLRRPRSWIILCSPAIGASLPIFIFIEISYREISDASISEALSIAARADDESRLSSSGTHSNELVLSSIRMPTY